MEVNNIAVVAVVQDLGFTFLSLPYRVNIISQLLKAIILFTSLMAHLLLLPSILKN
jgi:hypothetical protein